ncbi:MAG: dTDP-4-dehydrorhamnose 3,5-epimerase [Alphaproteobacteria bacterium]|nr:dTDP-4-dehydrorhamnose 3,5-epimerase [Alphaproteobacteria bacterium]
MNLISTPLKDCFILENKIFYDDRGFFTESYNKNRLDTALEKDLVFVQDNLSFSTKGTLRGIHFQTGDFAQTKLVTVLQGEVWDVAVDLRPNSPSFKQWFGVLLSAENKKQFLIPKGFGHAFVVLSESALFFYKCDNFYSPKNEGGIRYNDPELHIDWQLESSLITISKKDDALPFLNRITNF